MNESHASPTSLPSANLIVGWRAIAAAAGLNAASLVNCNSLGRLRVEPMKIGRRVAMTLAQVAELRATK